MHKSDNSEPAVCRRILPTAFDFKVLPHPASQI